MALIKSPVLARKCLVGCAELPLGPTTKGCGGLHRAIRSAPCRAPVLIAMDYFTKWLEAYAIPDQEAETVADVRVDGMFSRFITARTIHSNQGRIFESKLFNAMGERPGMEKTRTIPLHPQNDGLVEQFNTILAQ